MMILRNEGSGDVDWPTFIKWSGGTLSLLHITAKPEVPLNATRDFRFCLAPLLFAKVVQHRRSKR
jgi:hypothetical protein